MILFSLEDFEEAVFDTLSESCDLEFSSELNKVFLDMSGKEIALFIKKIVDKNVDENYPSGMSSWFCQLKIMNMLNSDILKKISLSKNLPFRFHIKILEEAYYEDISIYDRILEDEEYPIEVRVHSAYMCSQESLKKRINDKNYKIRSVCYTRLGPKYSLPYMKRDLKSEARCMAVSTMPRGSKDLMFFVNDKSSKVLEQVINKISLDDIPYFLGNSKVKKNKKISDIIKKRFEDNV